MALRGKRAARTAADRFDITDRMYAFTLLLMLSALLLALVTGLMPSLLAGLLVYFIADFGARQLGHVGVIPTAGRLILVMIVALALIVALTMGIASAMSYVSEGPESFVVLLQKMADTVAAAKQRLPGWIVAYLPASVEEWQAAVSAWLRENAGAFRVYGKEAGYLIGHMIFGMIIGGMIAIRPGFDNVEGPLGQAFSDRVICLGTAFRRIVFSQLRISAFNTALTGVFLVIVMPALGYTLPLTKTMITVTFLAGLLPIVGNLISNSVICLIALSVAPMAAVGSLAYLVLIHKLEYFCNAHIIGTQIKARAWEILLAMLVMESLFGIAGVVAAPVYYAYLKDELTARKLI